MRYHDRYKIIYVKRELVEEVEKIAKRVNMPTSRLINIAVAHWLKSIKKKEKLKESSGWDLMKFILIGLGILKSFEMLSQGQNKDNKEGRMNK